MEEKEKRGAGSFEAVARIGLLGDIHSENENLAVAVDFLGKKKPDIIACVGDIADGRGDVNECCHILQSAGVLTVRGNHDRWLFTDTWRDLPNSTFPSDLDNQSLSFLSSLEPTIEFDTVSGRALLCHGLGENDMVAVSPIDRDYFLKSKIAFQDLLQGGDFTYVLCGHSHIRMVRSFGEMTVVNAGTLSYDEENFCYIDFSERVVWFYDIEPNNEVSEVRIVEMAREDWAD